MKKIWILGAALCLLLSFGSVNVSACIGDKSGTTDAATNCAEPYVEGETDIAKPELEISEKRIDFGYFSEVGRSYTESFDLYYNITGETANAIKMSVEADDTEGIYDDSKLGYHWVAFVGGVKKFELSGSGVKTIRIRANVPADAKAGSQYAKIKVTNETTGKTVEVKVRMTVATEGVKFGGSISGNSVAPISISDKANAVVKVKNEGNAGFEATYTARATAKFGLEDWKDLASFTKEVYPGSEVEFKSSDADATLGYGLFTVEQKIVYVNDKGEQIEEVSKRTVLNLPVWALAVAGGVIVLILVICIVVKTLKKKNGSTKSKKTAKKSKKNEE